MNGYTCYNCRYVNHVDTDFIINNGVKKDRETLDLKCESCGEDVEIKFELNIIITSSSKSRKSTDEQYKEKLRQMFEYNNNKNKRQSIINKVFKRNKGK